MYINIYIYIYIYICITVGELEGGGLGRVRRHQAGLGHALVQPSWHFPLVDPRLFSGSGFTLQDPIETC